MPVYRVYKTGSPYNASELDQIDYEQTADVIYIAHDNHPPGKLVRKSHTSWSFSNVAFAPTIAAPTGLQGTATIANTDEANTGNAYFPQVSTYQVTAFNEETGQESRVSNKVSLTNDLGLKRNYNTIHWNAVAGATGYRIYKSENTQSYGNIGTTDVTNFTDDNIGPDLSSGVPVGDNPFEAAGDRPSTITFHEQRSWWGRTRNRPNGLWASRSADYENMDFTRPGREDDSLIIGLVANKVNSINHLQSSKQGLLALTSNNIFSIQGSNEDYITAIPPPRVRPEVSRGASRLKPISVDNVVFYETSKTGEIRTIGYEYENDGMRTDDVSLFSRHLFENFDVTDWAYSEKPSSIIVAIRNDGKAVVMTWDQTQQVWGWVLWETDGLFKRVCSITEQGEDRIYFLVQRTVAGVAKYYIERMASDMWSDQKDACYLDCARSFTNVGYVAVYDRLSHLEGRTVVAWVDGAAISVGADGNPLVVTNGTITLPIGGNKVTVGLPFTSEIQPLPPAVQSGQGWTVTRPQAVTRAFLKVVNSRNIKAGVDEDQIFPLKQREREDYDDPIALYTGNLEVKIGGSSGDEASIIVRSEDPTPFHVAAMLFEYSFGDQ